MHSPEQTLDALCEIGWIDGTHYIGTPLSEQRESAGETISSVAANRENASLFFEWLVKRHDEKLKSLCSAETQERRHSAAASFAVPGMSNSL